MQEETYLIDYVSTYFSSYPTLFFKFRKKLWVKQDSYCLLKYNGSRIKLEKNTHSQKAILHWKFYQKKFISNEIICI